jgi:protein-S-isoprenylcysteine O-methyltransferase Ste14
MTTALLGCGWGFWCALHSALISLTVTRFLHRRLPGLFHWHRLVFNAVSAVTFLFLAVPTLGIDSPILVEINGYWQIPRFLMLGAAAVLFHAGAAGYDMARFLGTRQLREPSHALSLTPGDHLNLTGIHRRIRHPWYLAALLLIWSWWWEVRISFLAVNLILTLYILVGTLLEERKLLLAFGPAYRAYQERVPMFVPLPPRLRKPDAGRRPGPPPETEPLKPSSGCHPDPARARRGTDHTP